MSTSGLELIWLWPKLGDTACNVNRENDDRWAFAAILRYTMAPGMGRVSFLRSSSVF